jgi:adenosylmethionine-8-amino-7-oxononanoate aminotransferase
MVTNRLSSSEIEELKQMAADHFWPHSRAAGDLSDETGLRLVTKAKGVWVEDAEGNQWFDTMAGLWLKNIGHGRKEIAEAVYQQMQDISFSPGGTVSPATARLGAKVASLAPDKDSRIYFVSGGSEAVETALKMAKNYHQINGEPNRWKVISRRGSYHGATLACTSLGRGGGHGASRPADFGPLVPGNIHVANPDAYRGIFGNGVEAAKDIERAIQHEGPSTVAAFIGEPISAAAGVHVPDPEYWPAVRDICDKYGVIMICDEVITGFGRTGKMFATEHWDIKPDIFTVAKALTSGYLPIGAAVASKKVADTFIGNPESTFQHLFTFGGNPAACAAGLVNLEIMEGEGMIENSATMGNYLYEHLQTLYKHPIVGDVRGGMGLLCGVELVRDRDTKERFPKEAKINEIVPRHMVKHRLLGRGGDVIFIAPPLCITKDEVDHVVTQLDEIIGAVEEELK